MAIDEKCVSFIKESTDLDSKTSDLPKISMPPPQGSQIFRGVGGSEIGKFPKVGGYTKSFFSRGCEICFE